MNARITAMLASRHIQEADASDAEVAGMWAKALRTLRSSGVAGLNRDSALTITYQAALQAATAVVRCSGYRVRGEGHHQHTFDAAAAVGSAEVEAAARDLNVIRRRRHRAVYDWDGATTAEDVDALRQTTERLLASAHAWLAAERPGLSLDPPPNAPGAG